MKIAVGSDHIGWVLKQKLIDWLREQGHEPLDCGTDSPERCDYPVPGFRVAQCVSGGEADCGGLIAYNYYSGEHLTGFEQGRPLFTRHPGARFNLANCMRTLLFSAMGTLKLGMDILTEREQVRLDGLLGHGGLFKTKGVGQKLMAAALNTPVSVMDSAGEGGAWGIALLAAFMLHGKGDTLENFLAQKVFAGNAAQKESNGTAIPDPADVQGFRRYMQRYSAGLAIERAAVENMEE